MDAERAESICERLSGQHDFRDVTPDDAGTVGELSMIVRGKGEFFVVDVQPEGFARQLVRRLVTALDEVARGRRDSAFIRRALDDEPPAGPDGIQPASPESLVLFDVQYPGVEFVVDEAAAESAREVFQRRRRERLAGARVSEALDPTTRGIGTGDDR